MERQVIFDESSMWMSTAPEIGSGSTVGEHLPEGEIEYDAGNPTPVNGAYGGHFPFFGCSKHYRL